MKKQHITCWVLIAVCLAIFFGYRALDAVTTDTKAPVISVEDETLQVSVHTGEEGLLQGITAQDDRDGDVTASLVVEKILLVDTTGGAEVTYAAFDSSGNVTKLSRRIQYTDYTSPRFSLEAPLAYIQNTGVNILERLHAEDVLDGDISHRIHMTYLEDAAVNTLGIHNVQFRITNSMGDTVELVLPVEVYAAGTYRAKLELQDYLVYLPAGSDFNAADYLKEFSFNNSVTDLSSGLPENFSLDLLGEVDTATPGVYTVAYTVTYTIPNEANPSQSQSYSGYSKLIVIVEG